MKFRYVMHFLLLFFLFPVPLVAGEASPLYSIDVDVKNQTFVERKAAIRHGFDQVILRLTGTRASLESPVIKEAHRKAEQWVAQFSYRQGDADEPEAIAANLLRIDFDPETIEQLLFDAGYEPWLGSRKKTVIALEFYGFDELGFAEDSFFLEEQRQQWGEIIAEMSQRYALPVRLADWNEVADQEMSVAAGLETQKKIFLTDEEAMLKDAEENSFLLTQYAAPSVLLGRLSLDRQGQWQTRWQHYLYGEKVMRLFDKGEAVEIVDRLGLSLTERLRENFFSHRIIKEQGHVLLSLRGITTLADFQAAEAWLNNLEHIVSMRVSSIREDEVLYELAVVGGAIQFQEDIDDYGKMRKVEVMPLSSQDQMDGKATQISEELIYQWGN